LGTYDGARIHAAALEPHTARSSGKWAAETRRPVSTSTIISNGRFEVSCPGALQRALHYPSWALWIDLNRDGLCGEGDVGLHQGLYGWVEPIDRQVGPGSPSGGTGLDAFVPLSQLGVGTAFFCTTYFPSN
jgi:hypothetical protein